MPLTPQEIASFAVRLTSARYLDPECCAREDDAVAAKLAAASGLLGANLQRAAVNGLTKDTIGPFFRKASEGLALLDEEHPPSCPSVQSAGHFLGQLAAGIGQCGDGDEARSCGLLELAAVVESRVRELLQVVAKLPEGVCSPLHYVAAVTDDGRDFAPFRMNGVTNIKRSPRVITIVVEAVNLTSRDLWHLAYILHHELICHAFQSAVAGNGANAHANCHWSEGWMDTVTFDFVTDWVDDADRPLHWLPLCGDDAKGELWKFHDRRYSSPLDLAQSDIMRRRRAREAYRRLAKTLAECCLASDTEAFEIARRFALAANMRADCHQLKALSSKLQIALTSQARPNAAVGAATACFAFAHDLDLDKLGKAVSELSI